MMHIAIVLLLSVVSAGTDSCTPSKCNASIEDADDEVSLLHHYSKISRSGSREMQKVAHSSNSESLTVPIRKAAASTEWYTIPVENFSTYTTRAQYGETLAHDGKIYFTPHDASEFLILDTATDVLSVVPTDSILPEPSAGHWLGITIYEGKIYCAPATAEQLLVYDPQTLSLSGVPTSPVFTGAAKWNGVAGWDKKIYAAPMNPEVLLVVDLVTNNATTHLESPHPQFAQGGANGWDSLRTAANFTLRPLTRMAFPVANSCWFMIPHRAKCLAYPQQAFPLVLGNGMV